MNRENDPKNQNQQQPESANVEVLERDMILVRRPRPGSVVILAPPGTGISSAGTEDYLKVVLYRALSE